MLGGWEVGGSDPPGRMGYRVKSQTHNHFQSDVFNLSVIRGGLGMVVVGLEEDWVWWLWV